jgi:DNA-binding LytR/AlgR family response regulator
MKGPPSDTRCRILAVDDERGILDDYALTFDEESGKSQSARQLNTLAEELFGNRRDGENELHYELVTCSQGEDAVEAVRRAKRENKPFDFAFLDIIMPPGINGVETAKRIRVVDPEINIAFVTAYSDWTRQELTDLVPPARRLFHFQKPFDASFLRKFVEPLFLSCHLARQGISR